MCQLPTHYLLCVWSVVGGGVVCITDTDKNTTYEAKLALATASLMWGWMFYRYYENGAVVLVRIIPFRLHHRQFMAQARLPAGCGDVVMCAVFEKTGLEKRY